MMTSRRHASWAHFSAESVPRAIPSLGLIAVALALRGGFGLEVAQPVKNLAGVRFDEDIRVGT